MVKRGYNVENKKIIYELTTAILALISAFIVSIQLFDIVISPDIL